MRKKIMINVVLFATFLLSGSILFKSYTQKSTGYNLNKIIFGSNEEKYKAMEILVDNNVKIAIPLIIKEVDNNDKVIYKNKMPEEVGCFATLALGDLTGLDYGNTCCCEYDRGKTKDEIIDDWQKWYEENYADWILNNY